MPGQIQRGCCTILIHYLQESPSIYPLFFPLVLQLALAEGQSEGLKAGLESKELVFLVQVTCQVTLICLRDILSHRSLII